jgi:hypothetical protein
MEDLDTECLCLIPNRSLHPVVGLARLHDPPRQGRNITAPQRDIRLDVIGAYEDARVVRAAHAVAPVLSPADGAVPVSCVQIRKTLRRDDICVDHRPIVLVGGSARKLGFSSSVSGPVT